MTHGMIPAMSELLQISKLVPSERILDEVAVHRAKAQILAGKYDPPRVTVIEGIYYVSDGNHRVMAAKELGLDCIECTLQPHKGKLNVSDYDSDDCKAAVKLGLTGFEGIKIGTKEEKELEYETDDEFGDDIEL
jgi:ParB-like chromosome segregation protein Spo0J